MLTAAHELIVQAWSDDDESILRRRNHVSFLMEAAREAPQAAIYTGNEIDKHRGSQPR